MEYLSFVNLSENLENAGLLWKPEIGDEVSVREDLRQVSILVDPQGHTPGELRKKFLWLPNVEQLVEQIEARQAILLHVGLELSEGNMDYRSIVKASFGSIEARAENIRMSLGFALKDLLTGKTKPQSGH
jgi:hypothetical protein